MREFPTLSLLDPTEADLTEARTNRAEFLYEGHNRFAQPLLALFIPLIGFSMLLLGGFSRFGLWRQIGAAIVALVVVQFVSNAAALAATQSETAWPLVYLPVPVAAGIALVTLWLAGRNRRIRRVSP